ncbi:MBL fold metallo-hydrolase [Desulforhopalus sp. IMCC35007]|uniref:MBL fold metallo-hydrolase n=1 Tax=Desulforhopalus sp. IMCC35007 TaxID=2569543 RepID=UPI0010AEC4EC|nr:MBL fold metallo-hydrolase [Desulforhopalus sp. IMCC35007]TKB07999.1 MBL fold metallo-hydrolase [Desulforhopalus sp. IMCC35007]
MEVKVLVDNNTLIDRYFLAEPGLSFYLNDDGHEVLFDLGYSDIFLKNAEKMGINLLQIKDIAISHGHLDHTWGLEPFVRRLNEVQFEHMPPRRPRLIAHPQAFTSVEGEGSNEFGSLMSEQKLAKHFDLVLRRDPVQLTPRLMWLGEIPRLFSFENKQNFGRKEGESHLDYVPDDSALAYNSDNGLVIITGCSHAGICNIVEHARKITGISRIFDIIGGLHLMNPDASQLAGTLDYLGGLELEKIHACHCTDLQSKIALSSRVKVEEVGVGLTLSF